MAGVTMTMTADTSELEREVFPALLAYGRRTLQEQCVTSATFIAFRAQKDTPAVPLARIDLELNAVDHISRSRSKFGQSLGGLTWTKGMMIAVMRTNPNSPYSLSTGNRWPVLYAGGLKGIQRWRFFASVAERMETTRHSSTHFLQTGWTPGIRAGLHSRFYKYNPAFGSRQEAATVPNTENTLDPSRLGYMTIDLTADDCVVTTSNDVGELEGRSNAVLAEKHRVALIKYDLPALNEAIAQEVAHGNRELDRRANLGWKMKYPQW